MSIDVKNIVNTVSLSGVVAGYKIEKREGKMMWDDERNGRKKGDPVTQYVGYVTVQTGENEFATVNVQNIENFYNGEPDFTSQALERMANEEVDTFYKTKDLTQTPVISIYGGVKINDNYYVSNGELHESLRVDLGFGRISLKEPSEEPRLDNSFSINAIVEDVVPEMKNDEETGRAIVHLIVPYTYGSKTNQVVRAMKMQVVAGVCVDEEGEYDLGEMILDAPDDLIGYSWEVEGRLHGYFEESEPQQEEPSEGRRGFGRQRKTTQTNRKRVSEYLLTGIYLLQDGDAFEEEDIREARQERERHIAELYKKDEEKQQQQPQQTQAKGTSFAAGRRASAPAAEPAKAERVRPRFR